MKGDVADLSGRSSRGGGRWYWQHSATTASFAAEHITPGRQGVGRLSAWWFTIAYRSDFL